jgi:hypothetical protein
MRKVILSAAMLMSWSTMATSQTLSITGTDCTRLISHTAEADVAYKPGVDVQGRAVAPADLNPAPAIRVPDSIVFDVAADLRRFGIPNSSPLFQPHLGLGAIRVERDGRAFFNGQPLESPEIAALRELCRQRGTAAR